MRKILDWHPLKAHPLDYMGVELRAKNDVKVVIGQTMHGLFTVQLSDTTPIEMHDVYAVCAYLNRLECGIEVKV